MWSLPDACELNDMQWLRGASLLIVIILLAWCNAFREDDFVRYGTPAGDTAVQNQATASVPLRSRFYLYGTPYTSARVTRDGAVLLLNEQDSYPTATLSVFQTKPAPSNDHGSVFYRTITDPPAVAQELQLVLETIYSSSFDRHITPTWAFVATWAEMTHPSSRDQSSLNTFQAVLIGSADWRDCFVVYMYNRTDWPTVEDRGSSSLAGFDAGDLNPEHQYILPGSQVGDVISVVDTSNVEQPGMWAFKIGQDHKSLISDADEFYFAFAPTLSSRSVKLYALITTNEEEEVSFVVQAPGVNNFQQEGVVRKGNHVKVQFPQSAIVDRADYNKGILVKTTDGKKVSVIGVVEEGTHLARFPVFQQRNSSSQYTYYAANQDDFAYNAWSFIVIVATADDVTVSVKAIIPSLVGRRRLATGREWSTTMNRLGTILISSSRNLTGTRIISTGGPIVVFSGHTCTQIPIFYQACDTIMEQIPSTYDWGKEFIASPLKNRKYSLLQIIAAVTPTSVVINCITEDKPMMHSRNLTVREKAQAIHVIQYNQTCSIVADKPIMLIEYGVSRQVDTSGPMIGGPAMILVPSVMQYSQQARMVVQHHLYDHFVNLVIPEMYFQPEKIMLNATHTLADFNPDIMVYCENCSMKYYVCQVMLPVGEYSIMHPSPEARFGAMSYGHFGSSSYGFLAGMASSGVNFENQPLRRVKTMSNNSVCLNTTSQEVFWRRPNGRVVTTDSSLKVYKSGDVFVCEAPFMGSEPAFVYKETVTFVEDSPEAGRPDCSKACALTVKVLPKETVVEVGDDITFHCIFPEELATSVTWQGPNLQQEGDTLLLKNVNISSSGKYTCSVSNDAGIMANSSAHLTVQRHLPVITGHGYQMNMSLNGTVPAKVIFNVSVDVEHGSIVWSRSNGKLPPIAVMREDGSLMIMDVQLEDAGQYSCTAKNESGEVTSEVFEVILEVQPPTMVIEPVNQTILVNSTLVLSCYAVGYGTIAYQWEERHRGVLEETGSRLEIEDLEGHSAGEYTCLASNEGGITRSQSAFLGVLKPGTSDTLVKEEMVVFVGPYELVASEGDNASFYCYGAYGSGVYSYLWYNNEKELIGNQTSLDIPFLTSNMAGEYTCLAHDDTGQAANATVYLTVMNVTLETLEIIKHPCNVDISITDRSRTVTFQCISNRIDAQYLWEMENQTITNRALGVNSSLLVIPNLAVSDAGRYRCTVSDRTGNISSTYAQLRISVEPPVLQYPPSDVTTAPEGNVTLACHARGYGRLTYTWEKKGIGVIHTSHVPLFDIVNASAVSAGLYRCLVTDLNGEKVVSLYFKLIVRHSRIVEYMSCNSSRRGIEVVSIEDLKPPSFLNHANLLLDGPVFTTSRKLSKTMQMVQNAMVYVCHSQGNDIALSFGVAISSKWVLTTADCEEGKCGNIHILPTQSLDVRTSIMQVCGREVLKERGVVRVQTKNVHTSPNGTSLVLLQLDRKSMLHNFIPKDTFLARKALMKIKSGYTIEILGTSFDSNYIGQPSRYKYKIRSDLLPDSAAPSPRSRDECSGQLPSTCSWIPGSPIIFAPPQTSQFAVMGFTVPRDECEEGGAYESHLSLQPELEWIETTVEY